jgi:cytochrome c-type biogenesis protein CcmF
MDLLGRGLLALAFAIALYGAVASIVGAVIGRRAIALAGGAAGDVDAGEVATPTADGRAWVTSGRRAVYLLAVLTTAAFVLVEIAFIRTDLRFDLVAGHSSHTTPLGYKIAAPWSSQEGSLLLWVWMLSLWSSLILFRSRKRMADVIPWAQAVLLVLAAFFLMLVAFWVSPFEVSSPAPEIGNGLSPLLQYPSMMIHPPMLYSGYTLFTVPFAFAVGALIAGHVGSDWIRQTRRYTLAAWLLLGIGIILGARWSYAELGWGGYWGWDAVENASLMPWLLGTAFIHSVMIQEKRGMLRTWNVSLILGVGILCILGTFIVRSGILTSIHAFGASTVGNQFLILLAVMILGSIGLVTWRRDMLRSENRIDSLLSREAIFLVGNVVLVLLVVVIVWGTFFPLIGELLTGEQRPLEASTWGTWVGPLSLILVALMALGPLASWRKTTASHAWRQVRWPLLVATIALVASILLGSTGKLSAWLAVFFGGLVFGAVGQELIRGVRARRTGHRESAPVAVVRLVGRNRRRYGGYLVHVGFAVLVIGVALSSAFKQTQRIHANVGDRFQAGGYELRYEDATGDWKVTDERLHSIIFGATVGVYKDGKRVRTIHPTRDYYPSAGPGAGPVSRLFDEATTEVALDAGLTRDIWVAMQPDGDALAEQILALDKQLEGAEAPYAQGPVMAIGLAELYGERPTSVTFQVIVSPVVTWIWIGAILMALGALIAIWPTRGGRDRGERARNAARVAQELGRSRRQAPAGPPVTDDSDAKAGV